MRDFFAKVSKETPTNTTTLATKSASFVPNLGTFHSQPGNVLFPTWEHGVPIMGIKRLKCRI
jgi:hypothetical protein